MRWNLPPRRRVNPQSPRPWYSLLLSRASVRVVMGLFVFVWIPSCTTGPDGKSRIDPFEPINRVTFGFNMILDDVILKPLSGIYTGIVPEPIRIPVSRFFVNVTYIHVIANDFLQGDGDQGFSDIGRLAVNSTLGIGGLFDPATDMGLPYNEQNFGVTMAKWGFDEGPYIVLPFFGPTMLRGLPDIPMRIFTNPIYYLDAETTQSVLGGVGTVDSVAGNRDAMDEVHRAVNPYIFVREGYRSRQRRLINGEEGDDDPFADTPVPDDDEDQE